MEFNCLQYGAQIYLNRIVRFLVKTKAKLELTTVKKFNVFENINFHIKLLRFSLDCTEKEKNLRLTFFLWVSCNIHKTRKYRKT